MLTRTKSFTWLINFVLVNVFIFLIAGYSYFSFFQIPPDEYLTRAGIFTAHLFFILAYIGQMALLISVPLLVLLSCSIFLIPKKQFQFILGSSISAFLILLLFIDIHLYRLYHFHITGFVLHFFTHGGSDEILGLSTREYETFVFLFLIIFLIEYAISHFCWEKIKLHRWAYFSVITSIPVAALILSYSLFFIAAEEMVVDDLGILINSHALVIQAPHLPLYHNVIASLIPSLSLEAVTRSGEGMFMQADNITHPLNYPMHPLIFAPPKKLPNIIIIGLDAWRFDMLKPDVTPHIDAFSKHCVRFCEHYSGGNATEPGLFSLFYSIPSTYWSSALKLERGPILIHELINMNYELGLFVSAETYNPPYNKTLFSEIPSMPTSTPGEEPFQRDAYITHSFKKFIKERDKKKPFFSFVFYNTSHSYCRPGDYPTPFLPSLKECNRLNLGDDFEPLPFFNRYKNALHYVDSLVGDILNALEEQHLLDNSIILILGDHGEEFNDNQLDYWGHASNFTRYQIQTPLIIRWPGKKPVEVTYRTSHFDIVPTLFTDVFKCKNPMSDYSIGKNLFNPEPSPYLVVGSYIDFGIVEKNRITRVLSGGNMEIVDDHNQPTHSKPPIMTIKHAFADTQRYYRET